MDLRCSYYNCLFLDAARVGQGPSDGWGMVAGKIKEEYNTKLLCHNFIALFN